jgi:deoxyribonuclease-4
MSASATDSGIGASAGADSRVGASASAGAGLAESIGTHVARRGSVASTLRGLPVGRPYQIFLGNPRSTVQSAIADAEIAAAAAEAAAHRVYVHSAYTVNLCRAGSGAQLARTVELAVAIGCRGVVVHVGKSLGRPVAEALAEMRANLLVAAAAATADCPLLLETPAGQGTELLTGADDFIDFVRACAPAAARVPAASAQSGAQLGAQLGAGTLAICVDTCHVFAAGHDPVAYMGRALASGLLRLVHFNDSATALGSRVDRHAAPGQGHIGAAALAEVARVCQEANRCRIGAAGAHSARIGAIEDAPLLSNFIIDLIVE